MTLPSVKNLKVSNRKVLLRTNYDVPLSVDGQVTDETRIDESLKTIKYLLSQKAKVIIVSHLDRPGGKPVPGLSLQTAVERLALLLKGVNVKFSQEILGEKTKRMAAALKPKEILVLENLRFDSGETKNDTDFTQGLAKLADYYLNDAFAVSHREHASIVGVPLLLNSAFGFDFLQEVKVLSQVRDKPKKPLVLILGGQKKSKIRAAQKLASWADYLLIGGKLVGYDEVSKMFDHRKILGSLTKKGEDITMETVAKFEKIIAKAKTIVWSGPMGAYEEKGSEKGTKRIAQAVIKSQAFTIVGGGDTEAALTKFGLVGKVDYVSSGGSAMLAFLAEGTLPGIEAIRNL